MASQALVSIPANTVVTHLDSRVSKFVYTTVYYKTQYIYLLFSSIFKLQNNVESDASSKCVINSIRIHPVTLPPLSALPRAFIPIFHIC